MRELTFRVVEDWSDYDLDFNPIKTIFLVNEDGTEEQVSLRFKYEKGPL